MCWKHGLAVYEIVYMIKCSIFTIIPFRVIVRKNYFSSIHPVHSGYVKRSAVSTFAIISQFAFCGDVTQTSVAGFGEIGNKRTWKFDKVTKFMLYIRLSKNINYL